MKSNRSIHLVQALTCSTLGICSLGAAEEVMPEVALVSETYVHPGANFRYLEDTLRLLGKTILTTSAQNHWDEEIGNYNELTASIIADVEARWSPVENQQFTAEVVGGLSTSTYDASQEPVGGLRAAWLFTRPAFTNRLDVGTAVDQADIDQLGKPYRRADTQLFNSMTWEFPDGSLSLTPKYLAQRMIDNTPFHSGNEMDLHAISVTAMAAKRTGTRSAWEGRAEVRQFERVEPTTPYQGGILGRLSVTADLRPSERTFLNTDIGWAYWQFDDAFQRGPGWDDQTVSEPEVQLEGGWEYRDQSQLSLRIRRSTDYGFGANEATMTQVTPTWIHRFPDQWRLHLQVAYLDVDNSGGDSVQGPEHRTEWAFQSKLDYFLEFGGLIRWYLVAVRSDSEIAPDFWRYGTAMQAFLIF